MNRAIDTEVLIVGAGPVGLTLAMDLAWRGVDVTVAELRRAGEPPSVKCNQISARSMEIFRRLGVAGNCAKPGFRRTIRTMSSPRTTVTGIELCAHRHPLAGRALHRATTGRTPRGRRRSRRTGSTRSISSPCCSRTLRPNHASASSTAPLFEDFAQDERWRHGRCPRSRQRRADLDRLQLSCRLRRRQIDCAQGDRRQAFWAHRKFNACNRRTSAHQRSSSLLPGKRAWMYLSLNPRRCGTTIAIDGRRRGSFTIPCTAASRNSIRSIATGPSARSSASDPIFATR